MKNVLIADDHEVTLRGIRQIIEEEFADAAICAVKDYPSVIAELPRRPWDLLLLDVLMPGANIIDALAKIRALNAAVPILILTALTEVEYVFETMRAGANGIIHKHRAGEELVLAIKQVAAGGTYLHAETATAVATTLRTTDPALPHRRLSEREMEIFRLIARGRAVKEIAGELSLSDKTVATYLGRIREKTGLGTHVDIARYALLHKLVE